jgi:hypothetical protein
VNFVPGQNAGVDLGHKPDHFRKSL